MKRHGDFTPAFLAEASAKGGPLYHAVDVTLKGKEAKLPPGVSFGDKDGSRRTEIRTRWYADPTGHTFRTYALQSDPINTAAELTPDVIAAAKPYPADAPPVFVGHYWLSAAKPEPLAVNVACLDYSVAKGGFLCAYRWDGEPTLDSAKFVTAAPDPG